MNEIKLKINFGKRTCVKSGISLTTGDYNSTKIKFEFDREDGTKIFEMKNPNNEIIFVDEIVNNEVILVGQADVTTKHNDVTYIKYIDDNEAIYWYDSELDKLYDTSFVEVQNISIDNLTKLTENASLFTMAGRYVFEISLYDGESKLTSKSDYLDVKEEQVVINNNMVSLYLPVFDRLIGELDNLDIDVNKSGSTTTVTLHRKDGTSDTIEIEDGVDGITPTIGQNGNWYLGDTDTGKPSRGVQGEQGANGQDGYTPVKGVDYFTQEDIESLNIPDEPAKVGDIFSITTSSTSEQIFNAFGGVDEFEKVLNASKKGELYLNATVRTVAGFLRGKITRTLIQAYYIPDFDDSETLSLAFIPNVGFNDDGVIDKLEDLKIKIYEFSYYKEEDNNPASISCTSVKELGFTNVVYYISKGICDLTTYSSSSEISNVINLSEIIDDRLLGIPKIYMFDNNMSADNNSLLGLEVYFISYPSDTSDTRVLIKYINSNNQLVDIVFNYNPNTRVSSVYSKNEYNIDGSTKQDIEDNSLDTIHKTISTAINEVNSIAKGANQALSYSNYQSMISVFNSLHATTYNVGQNVMIITLEVPDLWISGIESTDVPYTYTTDSDFTNALATNGYVQVGYYKFSALETQKVDLTNYVTNTDYANTSKAGVIKSSSTYATNVASGVLQSATKTYSDYSSGNDNMFISKGTLENVFTGKGFITSHQDITGKEDKSNKVTSLNSSSTDTQYPSAKAVYDYIQSLDGDEVYY